MPQLDLGEVALMDELRRPTFAASRAVLRHLVTPLSILSASRHTLIEREADQGTIFVHTELGERLDREVCAVTLWQRLHHDKSRIRLRVEPAGTDLEADSLRLNRDGHDFDDRALTIGEQDMFADNQALRTRGMPRLCAFEFDNVARPELRIQLGDEVQRQRHRLAVTVG